MTGTSLPPLAGATAQELSLDKLSPRDFERLCLWLVGLEGYERAEHLGAAGGEEGRDVVAWRGRVKVAFQCKRVQRFGPMDAEKEVTKVLGLPKEERPGELVFLVTHDVSDTTRRKIRKLLKGQMKCGFWCGTELDALVKKHPEFLEEFFAGGLRPAGPVLTRYQERREVPEERTFEPSTITRPAAPASSGTSGAPEVLTSATSDAVRAAAGRAGAQSRASRSNAGRCDMGASSSVIHLCYNNIHRRGILIDVSAAPVPFRDAAASRPAGYDRPGEDQR